jgi:hypothetical protein
VSSWRQGRKRGRNLYLQDGTKAADDDRFLGLMETPELAEEVCEAIRRMHSEWKTPFLDSIWEPRYPNDPQHEDPLRVVDNHGNASICAVLDGGSSTVRRTARELNLFYVQTNDKSKIPRER